MIPSDAAAVGGGSKSRTPLSAAGRTGASSPQAKTMRLRAANNRLKVEHSIIEGLRPILERLLGNCSSIGTIIPGRIRRVRDAKGPVKIRITTPTRTGWKAIALSSGARQELFVTTKMSRDELERALQSSLEK